MRNYGHEPKTPVARYMADVYPKEADAPRILEDVFVVCRVREIRSSKPESMIFYGDDPTRIADFTIFKNVPNASLDVSADDFLECKARFKPAFRNFTVFQFRKLTKEQADIFYLECEVNRTLARLEKAHHHSPNLAHAIIHHDYLANVTPKSIIHRDQVEIALFNDLFFEWLDWAETHDEMQPTIRVHDIFERPQVVSLRKLANDDRGVWNVLTDILDFMKRAGILEDQDGRVEISFEFYRQLPDRLIARMSETGLDELPLFRVADIFNSLIPQNESKLIKPERLKTFLQGLTDARIFDFANQPGHYRLREGL